METTRSFTEFNLHPDLIGALHSIGFEKASPVQDMTIPAILEGRDIFAQAETGSGKTGSFAIPILQQILTSGDQTEVSAEDHEVQYVILSPTRELAQQTDKVFHSIGNQLGIHAVCLIGGENIDRQKDLLRGKITILVATPGRLCDLIRQKSVDVSRARAVVFDEADRLFDMGFKKEIEFILEKIPRTRQLIMVSATSNMDVLETAYKFHSEPVELKLNEDNILVENIDHSIAMISSSEKMPLLTKILRDHQDTYALIFCNTQIETHRVAEWLRLMNFKSQAISGRLPQNKRTRLMEQFRAKEVTILVCTDVAARGLDIKDVNLVINYDLPQEAANYVHRIGRTGRAGKSGQALSFCAHEDSEYLDPILDYIGQKIPKIDLDDSSFATDIPPRPYLDAKTLKVVERFERAPRNDRHERKDRHDRKERAPREEFDDSPVDTTPIEKREFPPYVDSEHRDGDRRSFFITLSSKEDPASADFKAMGYFQIDDHELLEREVHKRGTPRFWFFGPREMTYRYQLKPIFKKLLTPFLVDVIKYMRLKVSVQVSYREPNVTVSFKGPDERLLNRNNAEVLESLDILTKLYLARKIQLRSETKLVLKTSQKTERTARQTTDARPQRGERRPGANRQGDRNRNRNGADEKGLIEMVEKMKQQVLNSKESVMLKPLDSRERRLVHQYLSDDGMVQTTSHGDGRLKRIEISLRGETEERV
jgi:ATP-dependent RNA helicase RhlE